MYRKTDMVRTVVTIADDLYEKIVSLAVEKYKSVKNISRVLNEILREYFGRKKKKITKFVKVKNPENLRAENIRKRKFEGRLDFL